MGDLPGPGDGGPQPAAPVTLAQGAVLKYRWSGNGFRRLLLFHRHAVWYIGAVSEAWGGTPMRSTIAKRSVVIAGHKTSISLEDAFWTDLRRIAAGRDMSVSDLVESIDAGRKNANLSSAIRLFVLGVYQEQIADLQMLGVAPPASLGSLRSAIRHGGH
jgi:predicted DNA-binding ribbon-helix-helix protein